MAELVARIDAEADPTAAAALARYFKGGPGEYGEGDVFVGVKLSRLRALARPYQRVGLPLADLESALESPVHEHRQVALVLLADRAARALAAGDADALTDVAHTYLRNTARVDNWDLVDCSAPDIVGGWLLDRPRGILFDLVRSPLVWDRRIALVATHKLIRAGQADDTFALAEQVLTDDHDLIHKASGWMLREAGKRVDEAALREFLDRHAAVMPRTMLRYAIERLPADDRARYLAARKSVADSAGQD